MIKYKDTDGVSYYFTQVCWDKVVEADIRYASMPGRISNRFYLELAHVAIDAQGKILKCRPSLETILDAALLD
jgi:hypothetical protein